MGQKTADCRYKSIYDFEIDAMTIVHNVVIYQGGKGGMMLISNKYVT